MQVLGPVLVMFMVGSLVFFFVEILYRGPHTARLCWVLGLFTFASVLVSRVSIQAGTERGTFYGLALAIATFITSITIVDFQYEGLGIMEPVIIASLIGLVMWSSSKLTWDCTVVDSSRDVSASGLLDLAGRKASAAKRAVESKISVEAEKERIAETLGSSQLGRSVLSRLFVRGSQENTPGLWVFYFSLFALPVFGLGQWFVVADPRQGHAWIFLLFAFYLGSGLGLLMVTSLLGLDRYLSGRKLVLPTSISHSWLVSGSVFAVLMMLIVLFVPRPNMTSSTSSALAWFGSSVRRASDMALGNDGQEKRQRGNSAEKSDQGERRPGKNAKDAGSHQSPSAKQSRAGSRGGKSSQNNSKSGQNSPSRSGEQQSRSSQKGGEQGKKNSASKQPSQNGKSSQNDQASQKSSSTKSGKSSQGNRDKTDQKNGKSVPAERGSEQSNSSNQDRRSQDPKRSDQTKNNPPSGESRGQPGKSSPRESEREESRPSRGEQRSGRNQSPADQQRASRRTSRSQQSSQRSAESTSRSPVSSSSMAGIAKVFVYLVGVIALGVLVWLFRDELAQFWAGLFSRQEKESSESADSVAVQCRQPEFGQFSNPFENDRHSNLTERQLIQYTYAALQAWARGRDHDVSMAATPYEFANQIGRMERSIGNQAVDLADLYCRAEFSQQTIDRQELRPLLKLWQEMSAGRVAAV